MSASKLASKCERVAVGGLWVPSVTVFRGEGYQLINRDETLKQIIALQDNGAEGVVVCGTTGRGHLMPHRTKLVLIDAVGLAIANGAINPQLILIIGTGAAPPDEAEEIIKAAAAAGFDGVLSLPPWPPAHHFCYLSRLARCCAEVSPADPLPLLVYDHIRLHPTFRIDQHELGTLAQQYHHLLGGKDSSPTAETHPHWHKTGQRYVQRSLLMAIGEDTLIGQALCRKHGTAAIAGTGNTAQGLRHLMSIFEHWRQGNYRLMCNAQQALNCEVERLLTADGLSFIDNATRFRIGLEQ